MKKVLVFLFFIFSFSFAFGQTALPSIISLENDQYNGETTRRVIAGSCSSLGWWIWDNPNLITSNFVPFNFSYNDPTNYFNSSYNTGYSGIEGGSDCPAYYHGSSFMASFSTSTKSFGLNYLSWSNYPGNHMESFRSNWVAGSGYNWESSDNEIVNLRPSDEGSILAYRIFSPLGSSDYWSGNDYYLNPRPYGFAQAFLDTEVHYVSDGSNCFGLDRNYGLVSFGGWYSRGLFFNHTNSWSAAITNVDKPRGNYSLASDDLDFVFVKSFNSSNVCSVSSSYVTRGIILSDVMGWNASSSSYIHKTLAFVRMDGQYSNVVKTTLYGCSIQNLSELQGDRQSSCPVEKNGFLSTIDFTGDIDFFPFNSSDWGQEVDLSSPDYYLFTYPTFKDIRMGNNNEINVSMAGLNKTYYINSPTQGQIDAGLDFTGSAIDTLTGLVESGGIIWSGLDLSGGIVFSGSSPGFSSGSFLDITRGKFYAFTCPYTGGIFNLSLGNYVSFLKDTFLDFNVLAPISCFHSAYMDGENYYYNLFYSGSSSVSFWDSANTGFVSGFDSSKDNFFIDLLSFMFVLPFIWLLSLIFRK